MCKIKSGASIKNNEDVNNLILAVLLRQSSDYRIDNICNIVQDYLKGSDCILQSKDIKSRVFSMLDILSRNGEVKCEEELCHVINAF